MKKDCSEKSEKTEREAKNAVNAMNAGTGMLLGSLFGHPISGLVGGCLTGSLMNGAGHKVEKK